MNIERLLEVYKTYSEDKNLKPYYHRTHMSLLMTRVAGLLVWCSRSKDKDTNRYSDLVYNASQLYGRLDNQVTKYEDESEIYKPKGEEPNILIEQLADLMTHILIYVAGNGWSERFMKALITSVSQDENKLSRMKSRFKDRRLHD